VNANWPSRCPPSAWDEAPRTRAAKARTLLQTDLSISPGYSGGGLWSIDGRVAGFISHKIVGEAVDGLGFATSAASAVEALLIEWGPEAEARPLTLSLDGAAVQGLGTAVLILAGSAMTSGIILNEAGKAQVLGYVDGLEEGDADRAVATEVRFGPGGDALRVRF
jgi:hypothetical protein